ncbi:MmcQ/YjbR family DNA-binding protein [Intrasporangium sp. YIM S08009]|uniref:MmcQ/YjbR family DNA-binding protein n=1 Tax=Intrasporangium zincisolvens TaxID=3080018 RepID=UPI002B051DE2|nr:MmcQ/YjbR family DNA-binding protein [Intrasporangium sp. YIM S08009]
MAHPTMYEDADPYLTRLRTICLALPGADEKVSHGRPNFFTRKVFAVYGGVVKGDHDPEPFRQALLVLPEETDRLALLEDERFVVPGYYGPYGWLMLDLRHRDGVEGVDWDEVGELVDASYRRTAPARLVARLDAS